MEDKPDNLSSFLKSDKNFFLLLLIVILAAAAFQIILYSAGFYSISADESGRTLLAYQWMKNEVEETPTWLPFYTIIIGTSLKYFPDLFCTPRIVGSIFGILAFISFIWLTHQLFRERYVTLLSAVIGLFFPTRVILSVVPLSESMFFFFIFTGSAFFLIWLRGGKNYNLILTALCFAVSSSVRYEGWVFSAALLILLLIFAIIKTEKGSFKNIFAVMVIVAVFPVYWLMYQADISGNPFQFFLDAGRGYERAEGITFLSILKNNHLTRFVYHNIIFICFPGLIALGYLFLKDSIIRKFSFLLLITFVPLVLISFTGKGIPTHNIWRVSELWNILLIPFIVYFIKNIGSFEIKYLKHLQKVKIPFIVVLLLVYYSVHIYFFTGRNEFSEEELKAGRYIEANITLNQNKILIEIPDWSYLNIIVASNKPELFVKNSNPRPQIKGDEIIGGEKDISLSQLEMMNIRFLLFKTEILKERIEKIPFIKKRESFDLWSLYEL